MVHNRRTALKAAAALAAAAAEIAAPGTVDAAPVNPMPEKFPAPPAIVEEVKTSETLANNLYDQVGEALVAMEQGETPVIEIVGVQKEFIPAPAPEIEGVLETKDETPAKAPATGNFQITGVEEKTPVIDTIITESAPVINGVFVPITPETEETPEGPEAPTAPVVTTPVVTPESKFSPDANWGTEDQAKAVQAFLDQHPTGSVWNDRTTYRSDAGCAAYAQALQDAAYGRKVKYSEIIRKPYDIRQYDIAYVGGHYVFVLEVLPSRTPSARLRATSTAKPSTKVSGAWIGSSTSPDPATKNRLQNRNARKTSHSEGSMETCSPSLHPQNVPQKCGSEALPKPWNPGNML